MQLAVTIDSTASPYAGPDQSPAEQAAEALKLNELQEQYLSETKYRPIDPVLKFEVLAMRESERRKPVPANGHYWMIAPFQRAYEWAANIPQRPPRRMGPIADKYLQSLSMNPDDVWSSFKPPARAVASTAAVTDLVNSVFLVIGVMYGGSKAGAVGVVAGQFVANVAMQFPMGYVASYAQFTAELLRDYGSANRSRAIKGVDPLNVTRQHMNLALAKARAVGDLAIRPTADDVALHAKLVGDLLDVTTNYQIARGDHTTYFKGKQRASIVAAIRQIALFSASTSLRLALPKECHLGWQATGISIGIVWMARALQIFAAAPLDEVSKQKGVLELTLEHTDVTSDKAYRDIWRTKAATRMDHADQDINGRIAMAIDSIGDLLGANKLAVLAFERAGGFGKPRLVGDVLTQAERQKLQDYRDLDPSSFEDVQRDQLREIIDLERRSGDAFSPDDMAELDALSKKAETSTMSAYSWAKLREPAARAGAAPPSPGAASSPSAMSSIQLPPPAIVETAEGRADALRAQVRVERAAESLTPREHARLLALESRARYVPPDTQHKYFERDMLVSRDVNALIEAGDGRKLAKLQGLISELIDHRLDAKVIKWDWTKLSVPAQRRMHDLFVGGKSQFAVGMTSTRNRVVQPQFIVPTWVSRLGGQLHLVVFGPIGPFLVSGALRAIAAFHPELTQCRNGTGPDNSSEVFSKQRAFAQGSLLPISIMAAMAGVQSSYNATVRRKFNTKDNPGKDVPSAWKIFAQSFPVAMFAVQFQQIWERLIAGPLDVSSAVRYAGKMQAQLERFRASQATPPAAPTSSEPPVLPDVPSVSRFSMDAPNALRASAIPGGGRRGSASAGASPLVGPAIRESDSSLHTFIFDPDTGRFQAVAFRDRSSSRRSSVGLDAFQAPGSSEEKSR